ncbi:S1 family peptidase [Mangrovibacterium lignilyticum]|uniref:S1 family peptidase n=1 Tax=Mangrovibacterium lignilyticum TaxID=2668052 RepID=UPI0013D2F330|nr:serine protease [Mangrovibacterium lignilyticum]
MRYFLNPIFIILFIFVAATSQGQQFKNNIIQYKSKLAAKSAKLIDSGDAISADSMDVNFKDKGYGPVPAKLQAMKKKKLSPGQIYDRISESTVIVSSAGRCGELNERGNLCKRIHTYPASGYIIDSKGIIVTNYHVANGYVTKKNTTSRDALVVMLKDGTIFPVQEVLLADKSNDLAILKIDPTGVELPALPVATKDAEIGDPVYIVSHPKGYFYAFSSGMVSDKFSEINAQRYRNVMAISADFAAGSSGAAIIDQYGNVIGTVSYTKTLQHSDDETKTQMILKATIPSSALLKLIKEGN